MKTKMSAYEKKSLYSNDSEYNTCMCICNTDHLRKNIQKQTFLSKSVRWKKVNRPFLIINNCATVILGTN